VHRPRIPGRTHLALGVCGVDGHAPREVEGLADQREPVRLGFPERRLEPCERALGLESRLDASVTLDCGQVSLPVSAAEGENGDQPVESDFVQYDEAGTATERVVDPTVPLRVVAELVERDVRGRMRTIGPREDDVDTPFERRQEKRAVSAIPERCGDKGE
jgi:hypothetical protein